MGAKIILQVVTGPFKGKVFEFDRHDTFLLGRTKDCHIQLPRDDHVSRYHFLLEVDPPLATIRDLGSLNGTVVNGEKFGGRSHASELRPDDPQIRRSCELKSGDQITVGKTTIDVMVELAPVCGRCGQDVEDDFRDQRGVFVCKACRGRISTEDLRKPVEQFNCTCCHQPIEPGRELREDEEVLCPKCHGQKLLQALPRETVKKPRGTDDGCPVIEGYDLAEELGKGGMGVVYRGVNQRDSSSAAIKVLHTKPSNQSRAKRMFIREIEVFRRLRHPNIVALFDFELNAPVAYCVMEYCNQGSLAEHLQRHGELNVKETLTLMVQALAGLAYAHDQGIVHRDLKPGNILLHRVGRKRNAKIADFGLAKSFEAAGMSGMTATGSLAGTLFFMPREQITDYKYVSPASDVWSIAATFYKALTGQYVLPFSRKRDPIEVLLREQPIPIGDRLPEVPLPLAEVLDRALAQDPGDRFEDASQFKTAVQHVARSI